MARTRKSIQAVNLHKYDVLIEDQGPRSDYFKVSQFDGYFYGGRNAFLVAGAGVLQPNSKILVEVLNKDGTVVYSAPVSKFVEGNSRLVQIEVYSDTPIGPGKLVLLGCADTFLNGTPVPDQWKNKYNVRWITDITISPRIQNKTPIRFLKQPSIRVEEKFYAAPSSSTFTEKILVPIDVQLTPKYFNVSQIGYQIKVLGPGNTSLLPEYENGFITGSIFFTHNSQLESSSITLPISTIYNSTIADTLAPVLATNRNTRITDILLKANDTYTYSLPPIGDVVITGSTNLQYSKLEAFNTASAISYAKIRIIDAKTISGEINKIRVSYKVATEPGEYVNLSDVNVGVQELLSIDSSSRAVNTGKFNEIVVNDYWYFATTSLQRSLVLSDVPEYYISSSLIGTTISEAPCCSDLLAAINTTPPIVNGTFVDDKSYFIGTRKENSVRLFPGSEYTLAFDAIVSKTSSSVSLEQSDYSLEVYLVEDETSTSKVLDRDLRGQLLGTLTPESKFLKRNFTGTEFNFVPKIITAGNFGLRFVVYGGNWSIANVSLKPAQEPFFSPDEIEVLIPNVNYTDKILLYKIQYLDINNNSAGIETVSIPTYFTGSQTALSNASSYSGSFESASFATTASYLTHQYPGDNRIITSLGSGSLRGESNLQFDGSTLSVTGSLNVSGSSTLRNIGPAQFTGSVNISGSTAIVGGALSLQSVFEKTTVSASAATGTVDMNINTQSVLYYTSDASGNWTLNIRGDSSTTLNSILAVGQTITCTFLVTNGSVAYYQTGFQIDGTSITPKWQGGIAPTAGNANSIDVYTFAITKTASATYTVLSSMTRFA